MGTETHNETVFAFYPGLFFSPLFSFGITFYFILAREQGLGRKEIPFFFIFIFILGACEEQSKGERLVGINYYAICFVYIKRRGQITNISLSPQKRGGEGRK